MTQNGEKKNKFQRIRWVWISFLRSVASRTGSGARHWDFHAHGSNVSASLHTACSVMRARHCDVGTHPTFKIATRPRFPVALRAASSLRHVNCDPHSASHWRERHAGLLRSENELAASSPPLTPSPETTHPFSLEALSFCSVCLHSCWALFKRLDHSTGCRNAHLQRVPICVCVQYLFQIADLEH